MNTKWQGSGPTEDKKDLKVEMGTVSLAFEHLGAWSKGQILGQTVTGWNPAKKQQQQERREGIGFQ